MARTSSRRRRANGDQTVDLREGRAERLRLLAELERRRRSRIIVYICGDREPTTKDMSDEDVRVIYDHLTALAPSTQAERIDLLLYSNGGDVDVPWRLVSVIREHAKRFGVLIPYRAYSAATMVALGADELVPTRKAELGPIDAAVSFDYDRNGEPTRRHYRVEDAMAFASFFEERVKLKDPARLAQAMQALATEVGPIELGEIYRTQRHTRYVAELLLGCRAQPPTRAQVKKIIDTLSHRIYTHSHALSRPDLRKLGLPLIDPDPVIEDLIWRLFEMYERGLRLRQPIFKDSFIGGRATNERSERFTIGVVESAGLLDEYVGTYRVARERVLAAGDLSIDPQISIELPPGLGDNDSETVRHAIEEASDRATEQALLATQARVDELTRRVVLTETWLNDAWERTVGPPI